MASTVQFLLIHNQTTGSASQGVSTNRDGAFGRDIYSFNYEIQLQHLMISGHRVSRTRTPRRWTVGRESFIVDYVQPTPARLQPRKDCSQTYPGVKSPAETVLEITNSTIVLRNYRRGRLVARISARLCVIAPGILKCEKLGWC